MQCNSLQAHFAKRAYHVAALSCFITDAPPRGNMSEKTDKRQCVRDHPSCWIPCTSTAAPSSASVPTVLVNSPATFVPTPPVFSASVVPSKPSSDVPRCERRWGLTPADSARSEAVERLAEAQRRSLKYRDPRFPGAGLLREDGGVFAVMSRAIPEGRSSWL